MKFLKSYINFEIICEQAPIGYIPFEYKIGTVMWHHTVDAIDGWEYTPERVIEKLYDIGFMPKVKFKENLVDHYILNPKSIYFDQRYTINKALFLRDKKESKYNKHKILIEYMSKGHFSKALLKGFKSPKDIEHPIGIEHQKTFVKSIKIFESFLKKYGFDKLLEINYEDTVFWPNLNDSRSGEYPEQFVFFKRDKIYIEPSDEEFFNYGYNVPRSKISYAADYDSYNYEYGGEPYEPDQTEFNLSSEKCVYNIVYKFGILMSIEHNFKKLNINKIKKFFKDYPSIIHQIIDEEISAYTGEVGEYGPEADTATYPELVSLLIVEYEELETYIRKKFNETGHTGKVPVFSKTLRGEAKEKFKHYRDEFGFFDDDDD